MLPGTRLLGVANHCGLALHRRLLTRWASILNGTILRKAIVTMVRYTRQDGMVNTSHWIVAKSIAAPIQAAKRFHFVLPDVAALEVAAAMVGTALER
jgi:hypothetical protein